MQPRKREKQTFLNIKNGETNNKVLSIRNSNSFSEITTIDKHNDGRCIKHSNKML